MAPSPFLNTYKTYKEGTNRITTWLVETARRCGLDINSHLADPNTFQSATSKLSRSHQIPLKSYTAFAQAIADSTDPKIKLPKSIELVLENVIRLRKQANHFFSRISKGADSRADTGHRHFVDVLEDVLTILKGELEIVKFDESAEPTATVINIFEALKLEETNPEDDAPAATKPKKAKKVEPYMYQPSASELKAETVFAIYAFFHDVDEIRFYITSVWKDYKDSKVDAMTAAVTTDTAIGMIKRMTEEFPESAIGDLTYPDISMLLMDHVGRGPGGVSEDLSDWICIRAANLLNNFEDVLDPKQVPFMKKGHFGVYDPKTDRSKLSEKDQFREDLIIMMELLPEFVKISRTSMYVPAEDETTTGLRMMMDANKMEALPMYAIFGTQIMLDIHHTLRDTVSAPFNQFQAAAKRAIETLNRYFEYSRNTKIANWPEQNDEMLRSIIDFAREWAADDMLAKATRALMKRVPVEPEPFKLLCNHPVLAGLMTFRLQLLLNEAGITLCNAWGSVLYPAHLYNATRKSAGLEVEWKDMDYIIAQHSPARMFIGAEPTDPQEYWKRFALCLGASATAFARNRRTGGSEKLPEAKKGPRGLKTTSPIRDIFRPRYIDLGNAVLTNSNVIAMLAVANKSQRTSMPVADATKLSNKLSAQGHLTSIQLLASIREGMAAEELHLVFDYFQMHQKGYDVLKKVQTAVQDDMVKYFGPDYIENESQLPYIVGYIFEVVRGSDRIAENLRGEAGTSKVLQNASDTLKEFLETDSNALRVWIAACGGTAAAMGAHMRGEKLVTYNR